MRTKKNTDEGVDQLPGEGRGIPSVNDGGGSSTAKRGAIVVIVILVAILLGGMAFWKFKRDAAKKADVAAQKELQLTSAVPQKTFVEPKEAPALAGTPAPAAEVVPPPLPGATAGTTGDKQSQVGANGKPLASLDKSASSLMPNAREREKRTDDRSSAAADPRAEESPGGLAADLKATSTPPRKAGMLGDSNFILAKGSFIDCALQTRLDSTVPGMTACVVTRNIYSDNGKVLLIERGSTVTGEYRANMKQGMARIFVLWNRIKTPNGVVIALDSPGADQLGGAGVPGYVDTHFWQRFGGAMMLSLIDDVARGLTSSTGSGSGNQFNFDSSSDSVQTMAAEALKNTINIPPTLYKNQGEQVGIYIARDLNFSSVYDVAAE
jgi:type IV secretion system protein VirB10